jgi:hypothetical protein
MAFETFIECGRNGEMCTYFVCDSNGRWLKDLHLLCCIYILPASVEGRLVGHWRSKYAALKC